MRRSVMVGVAGVVAVVASVASTGSVGASLLGKTAPVSVAGYWLTGEDGGVYSFGSAPFYGSGVTVRGACAFSPQPPSTLNGSLGCSAIAPTPSGNGYWLLNAFRWPTAYGNAAQPLQIGCTGLNGASGIWTGMTSSATGNGFLMVSSNGAVVGCGDAQPKGGLTSLTLAAPIVGMASTPDHNGYWMVSADGGVFTFGDASFYGSMGGIPLNSPVVGMAATPDGRGYWLTSTDGGVFSFGHAVFGGSMGESHLNAPVVGIAATPDGKGYWLAATDGGVFSFGSAPFEGSMGGMPINAPVVGIATYRPSMPG
jgi:hypothetical protein